MRVAITAYACKSETGSEPGAGYEWAAAAASHAEVLVITRPLDSATRDALARLGVAVVEIPITHSPRAPQLAYIVWLRRASQALRHEHARKPFDLTHHVTYATDWLPCPHIPGTPLVLGPIGGRTTTPRKLNKLYPFSLRLRDTMRSVLTRPPREFTKMWAKRRVTILLAQNSDTARSFRALPDVRVRSNCVVDPPASHYPLDREAATAVFAGRLIPLKGVHLAIRALAVSHLQNWRLVILGDGPERNRLEALAERLGVSERVLFKGNVPRAEAIRTLSTATCSVLLSAHDAAGWSAAESLAVGTPVVTWNHGGPAELLRNAGYGGAIGTTSPTIELIAQAIAASADEPLGARVDQFSRANLQQQTAAWYQYAVTNSRA